MIKHFMKKKRWIPYLLIALLAFSSSMKQKEVLFTLSGGVIHFISEAPLELIEAKSSDLNGIIASENQTFAFSVSLNTFSGFNSQLQEEHFNENYLESEKYPKATFTGGIIDDVDLFTPGINVVRAKGKFNIHGVEHVQMMEILIKVENEKLEIETEFEILLEDYKIKIPRIVNKKIAESIHVRINGTLEKK